MRRKNMAANKEKKKKKSLFAYIEWNRRVY